MSPVKKIVVIGPESTGKSTLCERVSHHFQTSWVPEYAREYLNIHGMEYTYEDLLRIAKGQVDLEDRMALTASSPLLIDTDMYVMMVWCEFVFGKCHTWILDQVANRSYDGYLLCQTDLPWVRDALREYPDPENREKLFRMYRQYMISQRVPWTEISGEADQRRTTAIDFVNRIMAE